MNILPNLRACKVTITPREHATIIAALRYYQTIHLLGAAKPTDKEHNGMIQGIATNAGLHPALTLGEIDVLVDMIN